MGGNLTWAGEHTTYYVDDILSNCTPETYIILLTNVTPMNSIKIKNIHYILEEDTVFVLS